MKKFNVILVLFLITQSTNTYSMNALRRAASRAATYVNRLAPRAKNLAESLLEKSPSRTITNLARSSKNVNQIVTPTRNLKIENKRLFSTEAIRPKSMIHTAMGFCTAGILGTTSIYSFVNMEESKPILDDEYLAKLSLDELSQLLNKVNEKQIILEYIVKFKTAQEIVQFAQLNTGVKDELFLTIINSNREFDASDTVDLYAYLIKNYTDKKDQIYSKLVTFLGRLSIADFIFENFENRQNDLIDHIIKSKLYGYFIFSKREIKEKIKRYLLDNIDKNDTDFIIECLSFIRVLLIDEDKEYLLNKYIKNEEEINNIKRLLVFSNSSDNAFRALITICKSKQLRNAIKQKFEIKAQGYVSFFHGQESKFGFLEDFSKELFNELASQGLIESRLRDDFLFIQNTAELLTKDSQTTLQNASSEQNEMIKDRPKSEKRRKPNRLSANLLLTGNSTNIGSCTWAYVLNNNNVQKYETSLQENVLAPFNLPAELAIKYQNRFEELLKRHTKLFTKGRLLLIAIPKSKVDSYAYLAKTGAYRTKVLRTTKFWIINFYIRTISQFVEHVEQNQDNINPQILDQGSEVAIPLTQAYALNPYSNIKVFAFDPEPTDQAEYEQYLEERKQLAEDIAKDVAELNKQTHEFDGMEVCCKEITEAAKTAQSFY